MTQDHRKRRMPTKSQWLDLRLILGNGWGEAEFGEEDPIAHKRYRRAVKAFENWLEDRYEIKFNCPLRT